MRRLVTVCVLVAATVADAGAAAAAKRPALLTGFACRHASSSLNRAISVTAVMRHIAGTHRLALKFELQRRTSDAQQFADVSGRDLGQWLYPTDPATLGQQPGDVWRYNKPVINLTPGEYRFRVTFRW